MIVLKDGTFLLDNQEAQEYLIDKCGVADYDIDKFCDMATGGRITNLENALVGKSDGDDYEAISDSYTSCLNEIYNFIDEVLEKQRIMKARDKFEHIKSLIDQYI